MRKQQEDEMNKVCGPVGISETAQEPRGTWRVKCLGGSVYDQTLHEAGPRRTKFYQFSFYFPTSD